MRFLLDYRFPIISALFFISIFVKDNPVAAANRQCLDACQAGFDNCVERAGSDNELLNNCDAECEATHDPQDEEIGTCYHRCREDFFDPRYADCAEDLDVCERICEATPTPSPSPTASPRPSPKFVQPSSSATPAPSPSARR